jgi:DNA-binding MarR family transcriptional regulator
LQRLNTSRHANHFTQREGLPDVAGLKTPPGQRELIGDIIAQFRVAFRELRCMGSQRSLQSGVSPAHLHLVSMLERHGGMPMSRIADVLDVSLSAATGLIDRMEERGLVERARVADDRRVVLVKLTSGGRRMLADVEVLRGEMLRSILERLDPDRLQALSETLEDLRRAVDDAAAAKPGLFAHHHPGHREPMARAGHHSTEGTA